MFFPGWRRREEEYKKAPPSSGCKELFFHKTPQTQSFPLDNKNTFLENPHTANIFVTSRTALFEIYHSFINSHLYTSHTLHTRTRPRQTSAPESPVQQSAALSQSVPPYLPCRIHQKYRAGHLGLDMVYLKGLRRTRCSCFNSHNQRIRPPHPERPHLRHLDHLQRQRRR